MSAYSKIVEALKELADKATACLKEDANKEAAKRKAEEDKSKPDCETE